MDELNAFLSQGVFDPPHAEGAGGYDLFAGVESLRGMRETFNFLEGDSQANVLIDGTKGSSLQGNAGNDLLFGNGGPDVLTGDEGNDFLDAGGDKEDAGSDLMNGGDGTDICVNGNPDFTSDCEADAGCPAGSKAPSCFRDVKFSLRTKDGLPSKPDDKDLPKALLAIEASGSGTVFAGPYGVVIGSGSIHITTSYTIGFDEREIKLKLERAASYSERGEIRRVDFAGYVDDSNDRGCGRLSDFTGAVAVRGEQAALRLEFDDNEGGCLSSKRLLWTTRNMKKGSIKFLGPSPPN